MIELVTLDEALDWLKSKAADAQGIDFTSSYSEALRQEAERLRNEMLQIKMNEMAKVFESFAIKNNPFFKKLVSEQVGDHDADSATLAHVPIKKMGAYEKANNPKWYVPQKERRRWGTK